MDSKKELKKIFIRLCVAAAATAVIIIAGLDMKIQKIFYDSSAGAWKFSENPAVLFLYKYGTIPGLLLAAFSMAAAGAGFFTKKFEFLKKPAALIVIVILLGPGIFINVILKNYTGRPRPREAKEFGGKWKYREAFQFGAPGRGHSFPAGHPSMGFLFGALYFAYRRRNKKTAYTALAIGLAYGAAMGAGRMAQGAHFFSDVLWSGVITFITARAAQVFFIEGNVFRIKPRAGRENRAAAILVPSVFILLLVFFFLFSVPFHREKNYSFSVNTPGYRLRINSKAGDIMVREAGKDGPRLEITAKGFGFPGRDYSENFEVKRKNGMTDLELYTSTNGFFSELSADIKLSLPPGEKVFVMINNSKGGVDFRLPSKYEEAVIYTGRGGIKFSPGKSALADVYLKNKRGGDIVFDMDRGLEIKGGSRIAINSEGKVVLRNNSSYFRHINTEAEKISGSKELYYRPKSENGVSMDIISKNIIIKEE